MRKQPNRMFSLRRGMELWDWTGRSPGELEWECEPASSHRVQQSVTATAGLWRAHLPGSHSSGTADWGFSMMQVCIKPQSTTGRLCMYHLLVISAQDATSLLPIS